MSRAEDQPLRALAVANVARAADIALRAAVAAGELSVQAVLRERVPVEHASAAGAVRIDRLLRSPRSAGPSVARRVCAQAGVSEVALVRELSMDAREELIRQLSVIRPGLAETGAGDA